MYSTSTAPHAGQSKADLLGCDITSLSIRSRPLVACDDELQFTLPDVLKVPPISHHGNVNQSIGEFGGAGQLRTAVDQLQPLLYAA